MRTFAFSVIYAHTTEHKQAEILRSIDQFSITVFTFDALRSSYDQRLTHASDGQSPLYVSLLLTWLGTAITTATTTSTTAAVEQTERAERRMRAFIFIVLVVVGI